MQKNDDDHHQSRFLEAPFVRMLRMRSASLKMVSYIENEKKRIQIWQSDNSKLMQFVFKSEL